MPIVKNKATIKNTTGIMAIPRGIFFLLSLTTLLSHIKI